jgi:hypothetical protein
MSKSSNSGISTTSLLGVAFEINRQHRLVMVVGYCSILDSVIPRHNRGSWRNNP